MDNGEGSYRRFLEGDEAAFDEIVKELYIPLVFFIDRYLHDTHSAEDIAVDTLCELIVHKNRYNFKVTLKTYLFMIGRSKALNHLKRRKRIELCELSDEMPNDRKELEDAVLESDIKRTVNKALSNLDEDCRAVVHLLYFDGLSYKETASVMKKSEKWVDNTLQKAKARLRVLLGKEGEQLL